MARNTGPKCRLCRREGMKLFLKGARCETEKCALARRDYPPGQVGLRRGKLSAFSERLREKQKVKRYFGVLERQFRRYYDDASSSKGNTGESLMLFFERRLDNVVFRLGWARSRSEARQMVAHGLIRVGGRRVNVSSYLVQVNDELSVLPRENVRKAAQANLEATRSHQLPGWIQANAEALTARIAALPTREDVSIPVNEQLIVELLSR